jgi:hypothetical protein
VVGLVILGVLSKDHTDRCRSTALPIPSVGAVLLNHAVTRGKATVAMMIQTCTRLIVTSVQNVEPRSIRRRSTALQCPMHRGIYRSSRRDQHSVLSIHTVLSELGGEVQNAGHYQIVLGMAGR